MGNVEVKRAAGYFLATICEEVEFHHDLYKEGAFEGVVALANMEVRGCTWMDGLVGGCMGVRSIAIPIPPLVLPFSSHLTPPYSSHPLTSFSPPPYPSQDIECQEYAAFSLAHLSSNREYQVRLVELGAVRPLVGMLACDAEPKHYAGLALLKLADNFENHLRIAEEGGIQALLRLGRTRSTDEQLQHKAALTVGQLATNAVKLMPKGGVTGGVVGKDRDAIGHGARMMGRLRAQVAAEKARTMTLQQLDGAGTEYSTSAQARGALRLENGSQGGGSGSVGERGSGSAGGVGR